MSRLAAAKSGTFIHGTMHRYRITDASGVIEFPDANAENFHRDLIKALEPLKARMQNAECPDMSDDYTMELITHVGSCSFHKDAWGSAFLLPETTSKLFTALEEALANDERFMELGEEPPTP